MHIRSTVVVPLLLVISAATARADSITIVQDTRHVSAQAHVNDANGDDNKFAQAEAQDVMNLSLAVTTGTSSGSANASLLSSYADPFHMRATGATAITYESLRWTEFHALAEYSLFFTVETPHDYVFNGTFSAGSTEQSPDPHSTHSGFWAVALRGTGGSAGSADRFTAFGSGPDSRTFTGTLIPGQYFIDVGAITNAFTRNNLGSQGTGHAGFDFTFDLSPAGGSPAPIPEPTSLLLVGTGVFAVARRLRSSMTATRSGVSTAD